MSRKTCWSIYSEIAGQLPCFALFQNSLILLIKTYDIVVCQTILASYWQYYFFSLSSSFEKDPVFEELNSFKYLSPDSYKSLLTEHLWSAACGLVEGSYRINCLQAGLPCSLSTLFLSSVVPEGYFNRLMPFEAPYSKSVPFQTVVSTNPMPVFLSKEQEIYGWMGTQSSSLPLCSPAWKVLWCHMGGKNTHHPSSDGSAMTNKLCFSLILLAIPVMTHILHQAASFTFLILFPQKSVFVYTRLLVIGNIEIIF